NLEAELLFDPVLFGSDQLFALKVKGDSMTGVHILDGDLAVIRPQEEAEDGQIVAVLIEGLEPEATLKVLRRKKGRIELQAANEAYQPLVFEGKDLGRVTILGRLVGVIRTGR
ncbi:MAG: S24 family peptidase, partial [Pseudomonadota bacterium]